MEDFEGGTIEQRYMATIMRKIDDMDGRMEEHFRHQRAAAFNAVPEVNVLRDFEPPAEKTVEEESEEVWRAISVFRWQIRCDGSKRSVKSVYISFPENRRLLEQNGFVVRLRDAGMGLPENDYYTVEWEMPAAKGE